MFVQLAAATKKRDHLCSSFGCYTLSYNICKTPHLHTEQTPYQQSEINRWRPCVGSRLQ